MIHVALMFYSVDMLTKESFFSSRPIRSQNPVKDAHSLRINWVELMVNGNELFSLFFSSHCCAWECRDRFTGPIYGGLAYACCKRTLYLAGMIISLIFFFLGKDTVSAGEEDFVAHHFAHNATDWPNIHCRQMSRKETEKRKKWRVSISMSSVG